MSASTFTTDSLDDTVYLNQILVSMKYRNGEFRREADFMSNLKESNALLKNGIVLKIIDNIEQKIQFIASQCKNDWQKEHVAINSADEVVKFEALRLQTEILFFVFYQTQIKMDELKALNELVKNISNILVSEAKPVFQKVQNDLSEWDSPLLVLLVVLQATQICALQQTTSLYQRDVDYYVQSIDEFEEGNGITQQSGSREGMDDDSWQCGEAKGLACLAYAVFRQPEVDSGEGLPSDVEWFLHEACVSKAYTYLRLCVMPIIQSWYNEDKTTALFYLDVVSELLENLAKIYTMSPYRRNEIDFPYLFFPPTVEFLNQNRSLYRRFAAESDNVVQSFPNEMMTDNTSEYDVDTLEDVLKVFSCVIEIRPEFASMLWPSHAETNELYHPFVMKALESCYHHPTLTLPIIRFATHLAKGPFGSTAFPTYWLLTHHKAVTKNPMLSLSHFIKSIDQISTSLSASNEPVINREYPGTFHYRLVKTDVEGVIAIMDLFSALARSDKAVELLLQSYNPIPIFFKLLSCAIPINMKGSILQALSCFAKANVGCCVDIWSLIESLQLITSSRTTATNLRTGGLVQRMRSDQRFNYQSQAIPSTESFEEEFGSDHLKGSRGLRAELEDAESKSGHYPITNSFLQLLEVLLSRGGTGYLHQKIGAGYRRPGIILYLEYIIDDVLLKARYRSYGSSMGNPKELAQRWQITARVIRILCLVIQHYPINCLSSHHLKALNILPSTMEDTSDLPDLKKHLDENVELREVTKDFHELQEDYTLEGFSTPQRCSRLKSPGFMMMSMILGSRSRLFEELLAILNELSMEGISESFQNEFAFELNRAVTYLQTSHSVNHNTQKLKRPNFGTFTARGQGMNNESLLHGMDRKAAFSTECDGVFWREKTLSNIVGLVYECSLREKRFNELCQMVSQTDSMPLTIIRTEQEKSTAQPLSIQSISDVLLSSSCLPALSRLIGMKIRTNPSMPMLNVMSAKIVEHVALHTNTTGLSTLSASTHNRILGSLFSQPDEFENKILSGCLLAIQGNEDQFMTTNVRLNVSMIGSQGITSLLSNQYLEYDVIAVSGEWAPDQFAKSYSDTLSIAGPTTYSALNNQSPSRRSPWGAADVHGHRNIAARMLLNPSHVHRVTQQIRVADTTQADIQAEHTSEGFGSIREAVIHLILTTLTTDRISLAHHLLGISSAMLDFNRGRYDDRPDRILFTDSHALDRKVGPNTCFRAMLDLFSPYSRAQFLEEATFIQLYPELAVDCFELIFRLISSPISSSLVIELLKDETVDFLPLQICVLLKLVHATDDELTPRRSKYLYNSLNSDEATGPLEDLRIGIFGTRNTSDLLSSFDIQQIKAAITGCAAWLLKSCSYVLKRTKEWPQLGVSSDSQRRKILGLLYRKCADLPFIAMDRSVHGNTAVITLCNYIVGLSSELQFPQLVVEALQRMPQMRRCFEDSLCNLELFKAGAGWTLNMNSYRLHGNRSRDESAGRSNEVYKVVDLTLLSELIQSEVIHTSQVTVGRTGFDHSRVHQQQQTDRRMDVDQLQRDNVVALFVAGANFNAYNNCLAATHHLSFAVRQFIELTFLMELEAMSTHSSRRYESLILSALKTTSNDGLSFQAVSHSEFEEALVVEWPQYIFEELALKTVALLSDLQVNDASMYAREEFSRATFSICHTLLRIAEVDSKTQSPGLLPEQISSLFQKLFAALRGRSSEVFSDMNPLNGNSSSTRFNDSYIGYLVLAISDVLQFLRAGSTRLSMTDSPGHSKGAEMSSSLHKTTDDLEFVSYLTECRSSIMIILQQNVRDLTIILAKATFEGSLGWRLSAIATLVTMLQTMREQPPAKHLHQFKLEGDSDIEAETARIITDNDFLRKIFETIDESSAAAPGRKMSPTSKLHSEALFTSVLSLMVQVASTRCGLVALLGGSFGGKRSNVSVGKFNILDWICSLDCFVAPPPFPDELAFTIGSDAGKSEERTRYENQLMSVLQLLSTIASGSQDAASSAPLPSPVRDAVCTFLMKNLEITQNLIKVRYMTLTGLQLTEYLTYLLQSVVSSVNTQHHASISDPSNNSILAQFFEYTIHLMVPGVMGILKSIGLNPLPDVYFQSRGSHSIPSLSSSTGTWWSRVQPVNSDEKNLDNQVMSGGRGVDGFAKIEFNKNNGSIVPRSKTTWSLFDEKKILLGMKITNNAASFLRCLLSKFVTAYRNARDNQQPLVNWIIVGKRYLDFETMANSFITTSILLDALSDVDQLGGSDERQKNITLTLSQIAENLICAVHSMILISYDSQLNSQGRIYSEIIDRVIEIGTIKYPMHSFASQIVRWIKDHVEQYTAK